MTKRSMKQRATIAAMRFRRSRAWRSESGNSLVELALVVSLFGVPLLLGGAEFGRLGYAAIEVSNAARAGAAYASQSSATAADSTGIQQTATNEAGDITGLTAVGSQFCVCSNAMSTQVTCSSAATTCSPSPIHPIQFVQVNTSVTLLPILHLPSMPSTFTLHGQQTMRIGQ